MHRSDVSITDRNIDIISFERYKSNGTNRNEIAKMKILLSKAIKRELTEKQRKCLVMYYFEGKKMVEIADELNLNKSTVTRHIQKAKERLKSAAEYYAG